jgi:3-phosphoshikimate 1-carboxyvinyltransferase
VTVVESSGALQPPREALDCGNSGTTMRLMAGILAGQPFHSCLAGDESLSRRPMRRIIEPLSRMGATIESDDGRAPLAIDGGELHGIDYTLPVASAQVKSAVLLAGLFAAGETVTREPAALGRSRDHTERMLSALGVPVITEDTDSGMVARITAGRPRAFSVDVPGDPSSAAFLAGAALLSGGDITIDGLLINPRRTGFLRLLQAMGAQVETELGDFALGEPVGSVHLSGAAGNPASLARSDVPDLVDEIPLLALTATQANGTSELRHAGELRVKETDRIRATAESLTRMGARIDELEDGIVVHGPTPLRGTQVESYGDHRIAMMLAVAGLIAEGKTVIDGADVAAISWPGFVDVMCGLGADIALA